MRVELIDYQKGNSHTRTNCKDVWIKVGALVRFFEIRVTEIIRRRNYDVAAKRREDKWRYYSTEDPKSIWTTAVDKQYDDR